MRHAGLAHIGDDDFVLGTFFACCADYVDKRRRDHLLVGKRLFDAFCDGHVVGFLDEGKTESEAHSLPDDGQLPVRATPVGWFLHIDNLKRDVFDVFGLFAVENEFGDGHKYLASNVGTGRVQATHPFKYFRHRNSFPNDALYGNFMLPGMLIQWQSKHGMCGKHGKCGQIRFGALFVLVCDGLYSLE